MIAEVYAMGLKEIKEYMERNSDPQFDREFELAQQQLVPPAELEVDEMDSTLLE
tara:strand:+ start:91 stop:252 length:162 start_codon:yes stop_codon:yes gene_type:complete